MRSGLLPPGHTEIIDHARNAGTVATLVTAPARMTRLTYGKMADSQDKMSYLDINQMVARTGLSRATIWRLKKDGKIPFYQPGGKNGRVTFPSDALERSGQSETPAISQVTADKSSPETLPGPRPQWMSSSNPINKKQKGFPHA